MTIATLWLLSVAVFLEMCERALVMDRTRVL
jgi:hypothetical protein